MTSVARMHTMMSYKHTPSKTPLEGRFLPKILDCTAEKTPHKEAIITYDMDLKRNAMTYSQLRDWSKYLAASLLGLEISRGDRVLLVGPTSLQYVVSTMALQRIGANIILLGQGMLSSEKVELIKSLDLRMIVFDPEMDESQTKQLVAGIQELVLDTTKKNRAPQIIVTMKDHSLAELKDANIYTYDELVKSGQSLSLQELQEAENNVQLDDPSISFFTSGSTGQQKLVTHTVHGCVNQLAVPLSSPDLPLRKYAIDRPLSWLAGCIFTYMPMICENVTVVHIPPALSTDDMAYEAIFKIWEDEKCDSSYIGAPLLHRLATDTAHLKYDISRQLKLFNLTGQRYSLPSIATLLNCFPFAKVRIDYGSTEAALMCIELIEKEQVESGYRQHMIVDPGVEIKIVDDNGRLVPRGTIGEICSRSSTIFLEYLNNPKATEQAKSPTGWFHTTDKGIMDEMGRVEMVGRDIELIKRAAANVVPAEIEDVLRKHPSVYSVAVVGVPDEKLGEEICACVILNENDGSSTSEKVEKLDKWCKTNWPIGPDGLTLAPKYIIPMKKFPVASVSGKIHLREIKNEAKRQLELGQLYELN